MTLQIMAEAEVVDVARPARPRPSRRAVAERAAVVVALIVAVAAPLVEQPVLAVAALTLAPGVPLAVAYRWAEPLLTAATGVALSLAWYLLGSTVVVLAGGSLTALPLAGAALTVLLAPVAWLRAGGRGAAVAPSAAGPAGRRAGRVLWRAGALAGLGAACALWWAATRDAGLAAAGSRGLIEVVGWRYAAAAVLVVAVVAVALVRRRVDHLVLAAAAATLAVVLYTYVNVAAGVGGFPTGWVHVGFVEHISATGELAGGVDARFSWPGFFAAGAVLVDLAGTAGAGPFLVLAPAFFTVVALPALYLLGRLVTGSPRRAWLGVFCYLGFNWFGQDYFAPQAVALVLYTTILAVLFAQVSAAPLPPLTRRGVARLLQAARRVPGRPPATGAAGVLGAAALLVVLAAALVVSHQLTPVVAIAALLVFTLTGSTRHRGLWAIVATLFLGWFAFGATDYWRGNLRTVIQDLGRVGDTVATGISGRLGAADPVYDSMQQLRIGWSALSLLLALLGFLALRRHRHRALVAGLALAPFTLIALQSYGGEVLFRCFVLAAPILAPLAAMALVAGGRRALRAPRLVRRRPWRWGSGPGRVLAAAALVVAGVAGAGMLTTTRGLNVAFERVAADDVAAADLVLAQAPDGSRVATLGPFGALPKGRVTELVREELGGRACPAADGTLPTWAGLALDGGSWPDPVACVLADPPDYVYVTATQVAALELRAGVPAEWSWLLVRQLERVGGYTAVFSTPEAVVLRLAPGEE